MNRVSIAATLAVLLVALPATAQTVQPDWITATNQNCKLWNPQPEANESVTWSGGCKDGLASGKGVLKWTLNGKPDVEFDGEYQNGKRNGPGVMVAPDGKRVAGVWVNDQLLAPDGGAI